MKMANDRLIAGGVVPVSPWVKIRIPKTRVQDLVYGLHPNLTCSLLVLGANDWTHMTHPDCGITHISVSSLVNSPVNALQSHFLSLQAFAQLSKYRSLSR